LTNHAATNFQVQVATNYFFQKELYENEKLQICSFSFQLFYKKLQG
jgi:hypothetical protein